MRKFNSYPDAEAISDGEILEYKDYLGTIEVDLVRQSLFGHVFGMKDTITFQGNTVPELIQAFHDSVDDYIKMCEALNEAPEQPFKGNITLRTSPKLHREIYLAAERVGKDINAWMEDILQKAINYSD